MRGQTEQLRVRKQTVTVELAMTSGDARRVEIFLPEPPRPMDRRRQVLNLLESGPAFVPARESEGGRWQIFGRHAVLWVRVPPSEEGDDEELFDFRQPVHVDFTSGAPLEGELLYSAQEQETRVTDYMNYTSAFFRLWKEEDVYLVNKAHVLRVIEN